MKCCQVFGNGNPNVPFNKQKVIKSAFSICFLASYCLAVESTADILVCVMTAPQFWYFLVNRNRSCIKDLLSLIQRYLKSLRSCIFRSCITNTNKMQVDRIYSTRSSSDRDGNYFNFHHWVWDKLLLTFLTYSVEITISAFYSLKTLKEPRNMKQLCV